MPDVLKPAATMFGKAHDGYEAACAKVDAAKARRDAALAAIGATDAVLDVSVEALAVATVAAGLGKRTSPFSGYSKYTPSKLEGLAYAEEAREVVLLCEAIEKKGPPAAVLAATALCRTNAGAVTAALRGLTQPQQAYAAALAARDALLPEWTRALGKLEKYAAVAWEDEPGTAEALLAPVASVQAPVKHKAKKK